MLCGSRIDAEAGGSSSAIARPGWPPFRWRFYEIVDEKIKGDSVTRQAVTVSQDLKITDFKTNRKWTEETS